jgi:hypothetical protein
MWNSLRLDVCLVSSFNLILKFFLNILEYCNLISIILTSPNIGIATLNVSRRQIFNTYGVRRYMLVIQSII